MTPPSTQASASLPVIFDPWISRMTPFVFVQSSQLRSRNLSVLSSFLSSSMILCTAIRLVLSKHKSDYVISYKLHLQLPIAFQKNLPRAWQGSAHLVSVDLCSTFTHYLVLSMNLAPASPNLLSVLWYVTSFLSGLPPLALCMGPSFWHLPLTPSLSSRSAHSCLLWEAASGAGEAPLLHTPKF